jgi:uncharacterized SAM-binding protein YcdF (DUF218 family)
MRHSLTWRKIVIYIFLVFLVIASLSHKYLLRQIGHFLVIEQDPDKADVIVVLNGRDAERSLAAVDLYQRGYANLIVLARGSKQPGCDEFYERVGENWNSKIFFQRAIEAMGIPETDFKLIGDGITSTYDEAKVTKRFLMENGYKSILLVTSKWHSKRAYLTFRSMLNDEERISIACRPSQYDNFDPDNWWKIEADAESVLREYIRFVYYILTFRISPLDLVP